ncbi:hypothetical protein [Phytohabitans flavus]|uniref:hypothetical protein n=1 Tax=Phytohabitans flavus TaxID=1076124 RepID=UPI001566C446|nr:hypothetical protein [Phytohabitans flavus]
MRTDRAPPDDGTSSLAPGTAGTISAVSASCPALHPDASRAVAMAAQASSVIERLTSVLPVGV